jgi:transcriptional regulator with XRE-family HTH domain
MKKKETIRQELGITQEAMAALLNIRRSQLAMYEIGKRDLSTTARVLLAEMQLFLQSLETQSEMKSKTTLENKQQLLAKFLLENQYKKEKVARKIEEIEKKQRSHRNALLLVQHIESRSQVRTPILNTVLHGITIRAKKGLVGLDNTRQTTLCIQLELLALEEAWLIGSMKKE